MEEGKPGNQKNTVEGTNIDKLKPLMKQGEHPHSYAIPVLKASSPSHVHNGETRTGGELTPVLALEVAHRFMTIKKSKHQLKYLLGRSSLSDVLHVYTCLALTKSWTFHHSKSKAGGALIKEETNQFSVHEMINKPLAAHLELTN